MHKVNDVMTRSVQTIGPEATLEQAAARMNERGIGALPVRDGDRLIGMITDRDITVRAMAKGLDPAQATVREAMTQGVIVCRRDQTIRDAADLMEQYGIRRLPVLDHEGHLAGIVSLDDFPSDTGNAKLAGEVLRDVALKPQPRARTYQRIVVALDGSELAEQVLPYVEPLAQQLGSSVTLIRAVTPIEGLIVEEMETDARVPAGSRAIGTIAPIRKEVRARAVQYLTTIQARLEGKGITVECEYPDDLAGAAIVQRARLLGADLIAMTTHGRGGVSRAIHGSVADDVLRHAPCAVLLVRAHPV